MDFHEKSLELNITHEILNLADCWYWKLIDVSLWKYWRPRNMLPFFKYPKSTAGGFHITTEGKDDPTGESGGGYDVRIKAGKGGHLLFIQYKKGELISSAPSKKSIFKIKPHEHYKFKINSKSTNQHFLLLNLSNNISSVNRNAVVYALPLIENMAELEANAGRLLRRTKFISVEEINDQANKNNTPFELDEVHNFRICTKDMNRCEVNYYYFNFIGTDYSKNIISEVITLKFEKILTSFIIQIEEMSKEYKLKFPSIKKGIQLSFIEYIRYLLHYFEVKPIHVNFPFTRDFNKKFSVKEFEKYKSNQRDLQLINSIFLSLKPYEAFINNSSISELDEFKLKIPSYTPSLMVSTNDIQNFVIDIDRKELLDGIGYLYV